MSEKTQILFMQTRLIRLASEKWGLVCTSGRATGRRIANVI